MRRLIVFLVVIAQLATGCVSLPASLPSHPSALRPAAVTVSPANLTAIPSTVVRSSASPSGTPVVAAKAPQEWNNWDAYAAVLRPAARPTLDPKAGLTQYHLDVNLSPDLSKLSGQAQIRYTNRENVPLDVVYLHLFPNLWNGGLTISDAQVAGQPVSVTLPSGDDLVGLPLDPPLAVGDSVDLALDFEMAIPSGEGVGNYWEFALQDGVLALAHFYPTVVVYDDGGWRLETPALQGDVIYHDASLYDVTLTAPADLVVAATGATLDHHDNGDGTLTWQLAGGPMRDFNIVASRQYRSESRQSGDIAVNSYFLPEHETGGKKALGWATEAVRIYEGAFGPYPYRELDVVETGTTAGGIEYPGMVVIASRLYDDPEGEVFFESATAHEVAHQWWYNVVGNDQINNPWLDEALAQYSTYLYYRERYGETGAKGFTDAMKERWARVDYADKPVGLPVADYEGREYGAIVYGRGPLFLLALRDQIGEAKMKEFLRRYYTERSWDIATPAEFQALAEEVSGQNLDALFAEWVYPKQEK
jgi:aminopeptidase N